MGRIEEIAINRKISSEELDSLIKSEISPRVLKRLYFIKFRYLGDSVQEAANKIGVTKKTGYDWQKEWNKGGIAALIPDFKGERKHKLTEKQRNELLILLKEKDHWTTREVMELIKEKFGTEYTLKQIGIILKNFGMRYSKPYVFDYRRPKNAEDILKKLSDVIPSSPDLDNQYIIGFLDESSPQTKANTQRLWSFKKPLMTKNTDYIKANAFAFYSIIGNNLISFMESSKAENVCEFLEKIVKHNPKKKNNSCSG